jgi:hypothetical protein
MARAQRPLKRSAMLDCSRMDLLARTLAWIQWHHLGLAVLVWVVLTVGSLALVARIVVRLPEDYFAREPEARTRWTARRIVRNLVGLVIISIGLALSVPGVPGQGLLTILVGLFLVDFPRRRQLERLLARRSGVLPALNSLRARFGRPPLLPPGDSA